MQISQAEHQGAAGNGRSVFKLVSGAAEACYLEGYPGVELVDASGHHIADASRSLTSFFGNYPPPRRVTIPPGGSATFDLTAVENDPCTGGTRAWRPAAFKITPPDDFDSVTVAASWQGGQALICPGTLTVHPVGSTLHG